MFGEMYETLTLYHNSEQLESSIKLFEDADIFHCHNEPAWFVSIIKSIFPDKPVVLDCHDSFLVRVDPDAPYDPDQHKYCKDERDNMELADALVFVSEPMANIVRQEYSLSNPYIVLPSYVPKRFYRFDAWKLIGGCCIEGRIDLPQEIESGKELWCFKYCEYTDLAKQLSESKIPLYLYTPGGADKPIQETYGETAIWKGSYIYPDLIRQIGRHEYGICGNSIPHPSWKTGMPNKLFEYIASGIPVIAFNADEIGKFLTETGFGMAVSSVDEIKSRWMEHREFRRNITFHRNEWTMEAHIHDLEELYRGLL